MFVALLLGAGLGFGQARSGRIFTYVTPLPPFGSDGELTQQLRRSVTRIAKGEDGAWRIYFLAFFNRAAGAASVSVVFYRSPRRRGDPPVNAFSYTVTPDADNLAADVRLDETRGFAAGQRYQMLVTRLVGGSEQVYARTEIELR